MTLSRFPRVTARARAQGHAPSGGHAVARTPRRRQLCRLAVSVLLMGLALLLLARAPAQASSTAHGPAASAPVPSAPVPSASVPSAPAPAGLGHSDLGSAGDRSHALPPPPDAGHCAGHGAGPEAGLNGGLNGNLCSGFGPQTPRDIASNAGLNPQLFPLAPPAAQMNLCNLHTHTNAEHKGPGFSVPSRDPDNGGYICDGSDHLTADELHDPAFGHGPFHGVKPGDTIEVHWVYSSCDVHPGKGLGACLSDACANPTLRVEAQVFLLVNDPFALNFANYDHRGHIAAGHPQPMSLPTDTGTPIVFRGSTTGPSYTQAICSPLQVTWSVRPTCARLDISSLYRWGMAATPFQEDHSHGVRPLVTAPELLSPIR